jgi:hypothetical protein
VRRLEQEKHELLSQKQQQADIPLDKIQLVCRATIQTSVKKFKQSDLFQFLVPRTQKVPITPPATVLKLPQHLKPEEEIEYETDDDE